MSHARLFAFEDDFVASLRCIPMAVRLKLDRTAIKLTLRQWSRFTRADRQLLLEAPCATALEIAAYRAMLVSLVTERAGEEARVLNEPPPVLAEETPDNVVAFARSVGVEPPDDADWARLSELERFALMKLTRDNHDNVNFLPAMREFGLLAN